MTQHEKPSKNPFVMPLGKESLYVFSTEMRQSPDESKAVSERNGIRPLDLSEALGFPNELLMAARGKPMRFYFECKLEMPTGLYELDNGRLSSFSGHAATDQNPYVSVLVLSGQQPALMEVYPMTNGHSKFIINSYNSNEKMASAVLGIKLPEPQKSMVELAKEIFDREMSLAAESAHGENKEMLTITQNFEAKRVFWEIMHEKSD